jgi:hypothetical protein
MVYEIAAVAEITNLMKSTFTSPKNINHRDLKDFKSNYICTAIATYLCVYFTKILLV